MNPSEYRVMFEAEDTHWWYVGLHELVLAHVTREAERLGRPLRILDAGCGTGRLCQLLAPLGHVQGVDASPEAVRYSSRRGVAAQRGDLNALELEPASYDVITCIDVLYHAGVRSDVEVMKAFCTALRPGGMLVLNLVALEWLRSSHDVAVHTRERYDERTLRTRLAAAGFTVELLTFRVGLLFPLIASYRLLRGRWGRRKGGESDVALPSPCVNALLVRVMRAENAVLRRVKLPIGSSLFAIARKGEAVQEKL
ncbi:methyltransferase domain-containing protein [Geomonas paludis]|uniref:Methyltransferase domain-containing protein n=1 Tax=Geomonas paludis TaxID=2740185 RepID=A0ABY4LAZ8_9BACT|nr:class I SAM-dependent methyltransferase [Geomonas paludis]UPU35082.1 methyltransferase domain-containing protein [Geomonas paludis]